MEDILNKSKIINTFCMICILLIIIAGIVFFEDRNYLLISILIAVISCVMVFYAFENKEGNIRRMVVISVMIAIAVIGRGIFAPLPGFKPVTAIVILAAINLGAEAGFIIGAFSALISDVIFGIGPWTPFQMTAWGMIGLIAGLYILRRIFDNKIFLCMYGVAAGMIYSLVMDIWSVLAIDGDFNAKRYLAAVITAVPYTIIYMISNVIFLLLMRKPIGDKLHRINSKHGIFKK